MRIKVTVRMELPAGASPRDAIDFVESALKTEPGLLHPSDPFHHLNRDDIVVSVTADK